VGKLLVTALLPYAVQLVYLKVPYPLISLVTRLPQTLHGRCPLIIRTRTFEDVSLTFEGESDSIDVFESVKELTVASTQVFHSQERIHCLLFYQHLWIVYMPFRMYRTLHCPPLMDGIYILCERSSVAWESDHDPRRGDLQISIKTTLYVFQQRILSALHFACNI
jgi:hypothetical protein